MQAFHVDNRKRLLAELSDNSIAVVFAGKLQKSSADAHHPFVVNRNFYYLTGIARHDFILVMTKRGTQTTEELFIEEPNDDIEKWVGRKMTQSVAEGQSGIKKISYLKDFDKAMTGLAYRHFTAIYSDFERLDWDEEISVQQQWVEQFSKRYPHVQVFNLQPLLINQRMIKQPYEIEQIRRAIRYTKEGLEQVMKLLKPGLYEYQLDATFKHSITFNGSQGHSFDTIAASGEDGVILHYVENAKQLAAGNLVLMDLGALENFYASDISRTYPISGRYSERQRQIYNIVLGAMDAVIAKMVPGTPFAELNKTCQSYLAQELKKIGLIKEDAELGKYYYHGVSHHLGLDVHDIADRERALEPGMVLTVEPGLYIAEEGIGIRIEDDILITEDGNENLSRDIIKRTADIEAFMA